MIMSNQHPVNILADTITEWRTFYRKTYKGNLSEIDYIAANAAQWGADQELEACVEWLGDAPVVYNNNGDLHPGSYLRDARRPEPPSLKEQALAAINSTSSYLDETAINTIRKALEEL